VWWLLGVGAIARFGWLCAGTVRLRQLRHRSLPAVLTSDLEVIKSAIAPWADVRISSNVVQPAGFGRRHPTVLLPETFFALDPTAQRTVVCHELLHVARGDWLWIVVEEMVRALFWFHPAVWWLVEQIQETREQLVDHLVIARIPSKRAYMTALLTFADAGRPAALAMTFLRRRHLRSRLQRLAKESLMSRRRFVWTAMVLVCVMLGTIATTVVALPFGAPIRKAAQAQDVVDASEAGVILPKLVSSVKAQYTPDAMQARIEGIVMMKAVVRTDGTAGNIDVTQSLDTEHGLDQQAVAAVSQWRFEPGLKDGKPVPVRVTIEISFTLKP
jgi:TonB family protein